MSKSNSIPYSIFKPWVTLGAYFFYKKIEIINKKNIPENKPVILVANHQSALMDVLTLCISLPEQLHWLTRADIFKKPAINKFLRSINMLPVYRERDKVDDLSGVNSKTIEECNDKLKNNSILCMFPEGTHRAKKQLMPLKKGVARIALNAVANGLDDLCIVPVGINHSNFYNYRTSILFQVGKPIYIKEFNSEPNNIARNQNRLLATIDASLKELMIHIETNAIYEDIFILEALCNKLSKSHSQLSEFNFFQKIAKTIDADKAIHERLHSLTEPYSQLQQALTIEEKLFSEEGFPMLKLLPFLLGLIPSLLGAIFFSPMYFLTVKIVKKIVKDPAFVNTIRFAIWTFLTPVYFLLTGLLFTLLFGSAGFSFIILTSLSLSGIIALYWQPVYKQFYQQIRINRYVAEKKTVYLKWLKIREELKTFIHQLSVV